ncbi:AAA family ATPase [Streptomyces sp. NPDC057245]|uniref:AAA family ATPase n=1 Tax=Streptomyces sp. NPDC057245 TaxID=3346065 RepID=UPI0036442C03
MATAAEAPASAGGLVPHTHFQFAAAKKEARPVRALLDGPPGSGRTLTALRMASALGESIAVIDTERGKSKQYADQVAFDMIEMETFAPRDLCLALYAAAPYDVVVLDCWSAFWAGPDGIRDQVGKIATGMRGGAAANKDAAWEEMRPLERQSVNAVLAFPGHVVATLRNRVEFVLETDAQGRTMPARAAGRMEARDGLEYEVDFTGSMLPTHELWVTKSNAPGLSNELFTDPVEVGKQLRAWAETGVDRAPRVDFLHRAYDGEATYEALSELAREIQACRASKMAALDPSGNPTTLGDVVSYRLAAAYARSQREAKAAARAQRQQGAA